MILWGKSRDGADAVWRFTRDGDLVVLEIVAQDGTSRRIESTEEQVMAATGEDGEE